MKINGAKLNELKEILRKDVRSVVEYAARGPAFWSHREYITDIERVQKSALSHIKQEISQLHKCLKYPTVGEARCQKIGTVLPIC